METKAGARFCNSNAVNLKHCVFTFFFFKFFWREKNCQIELTLVFPQGVVLRQKLGPAVVTPMRLSDLAVEVLAFVGSFWIFSGYVYFHNSSKDFPVVP